MVKEMIAGAIAGAIVGPLAVLVVFLLQPQRKCPECGTQLPKRRKPANRRQALWGGWTCPSCGCEIDRKGNKIPPSTE
jgi:hypothetical protein